MTMPADLATEDVNMEYEVVLIETEQGWSVSCPALFGCHSQGGTRSEALENIREAMSGWLAVDDRQGAGRKADLINSAQSMGYRSEVATVVAPNFAQGRPS